MEYHTKADGIVIRHHYENPQRDELTRTTYNGGTPDRSYQYTTFGQLHIAANATSTVTFGYDAAGRKTSETQALAGLPGTHTFAYFYDGDGNLDHHTRPDGSTVDYAYNLRNLLKDITADTAPPVAEYTYNGRNQLSTTKVENGLFTATRAYDNAGRLTALSNGALDTTGYTLSPDGRRTGITRNGQSETYGYDAARQVASASIPLTGTTRTNGYQYDAAANRSSATTNGVTTSYFANLVNEYTSIGSFNPSHDPNGNLLTGQVPGIAGLQPASFTWNIHNEMVSATAANGATAQYQYDALGRRTKRTETIGGVPVSTWFLANGWNVELEYENGAYARRMTWGMDLSQTLQGAGGVGGLVMTEQLPPGGGAPVPHFPTYDGNGNITAWVNAAGTVTARQRYDAFGNIIEQTGTPPSRYGFSTKPIELVMGFLYYGYRYYDPITGRWPSRDPIGEEGGINLYGFVGNDGVNRWDRLGLVGSITMVSTQCENTGNYQVRRENPGNARMFLRAYAKQSNRGEVFICECERTCTECVSSWTEVKITKFTSWIEEDREFIANASGLRETTTNLMKAMQKGDGETPGTLQEALDQTGRDISNRDLEDFYVEQAKNAEAAFYEKCKNSCKKK